MLSINNLSFYFGSRPLYDQVSLQIKPKDRIGLIGGNGTGKSTLLRLIYGEYKPDEGEIQMAKDCTIGFLNQDLLSYESNESILKVAMQAFTRQNELQAKIDEILAKLEVECTDKLLEQLAQYQDEFATLDGYSIQAKAEEILEGLGFETNELTKPLAQFSGGWRMRVMLAKLLLQKPSLLMLDEPTNHLDLPSIQWMENYINSYEGAVIIVSHDKYFLNKTVNSIVEVYNQDLHVYAGDYDFYIEERQIRREIQQNSYENQQQQIKQAERFIERFKAKASKSRQVQSRVKALDKIDIIEEVDTEKAGMNIRFAMSVQPGKVIYEFSDIAKSYGDKEILTPSSLNIMRGDKIALIGANGKGKSTMLRIIDGIEEHEGERKIGHNVISTFYAQHQLESLNLSNSILDELKQAGSNKTENELRNILGCFLFSGEDAFKPIKVLSGGEKSRVALAKTLIANANFLLLD